MLYFAAADVPLFDWESDVPSQVYFNNSRLFVTSAGKILEERNNYVTYMMVNANPEPVTYSFRIYQSALYFKSALATIVLAALAVIF